MQINFGGVSKVISSLAEDIEDKEKNNEKKSASTTQENKFKIQMVEAKATKNKSEVSGDSSIQTSLRDGKIMMAISDGMGSRT